MRTLVVCDTHDVGWLDEVRAGDHWDVLLLRVSTVWFERQHGTALARLGNVCVLDVAALAGGANRDVSAFTIDLVHRLPSFEAGGRTIAEWLGEQDRNLWWSLEISEKSSFRGPLVERLFGLALITSALAAGRYDRLRLRLRDPVLAKAGAAASRISDVAAAGGAAAARTSFARAYWTRAGAALARLAAVRLLIALTRWRTRPSPATLGILTLFPYWWIEPFGERPVERFFSAPPAASHYAAWITWPGRIWRHRRALARTLQRATIVPLQWFVRWRDAIGVLSLRRYRKLARAERAVRQTLHVRFDGNDVSEMVAEEVATSMADSELFFDHLLYAAVRRYLEAVRPKVVAFRVEGQAWEHAAVLAAHDANVPVAGFFHSMFGENYPALRYAPGEVAGRDHGAGARPLVKRMLVPGAAVERYLVQDGYPPEAIARCGPQRHAPFVAFLQTRPSRFELRQRLRLPHDVPLYFIALAIVEVETEGLFACLEQALATAPAFHLMIKTHPNRPRGDASMQAAVSSLGSDRVTFVPAGSDMYEYMAASDTMVCIGSTVAFEAMALDVMPVVYEHPGTFAATSLRAFADALYVVNTPASLRAALDECRDNGQGAQVRRDRWPDTVAAVFGDMQTPLPVQLDRALAQLGVPIHAGSEVTSNGIR